MSEATARFLEAHRKQVFLEEVDQRHRTNRVQEYLAAMEDRISAMTDSQAKTVAREWLKWCQACTSEIDPLNRVIRMPDDIEPTDEALRPFLPDWMRRGYGLWQNA